MKHDEGKNDDMTTCHGAQAADCDFLLFVVSGLGIL